MIESFDSLPEVAEAWIHLLQKVPDMVTEQMWRPKFYIINYLFSNLPHSLRPHTRLKSFVLDGLVGATQSVQDWPHLFRLVHS